MHDENKGCKLHAGCTVLCPFFTNNLNQKAAILFFSHAAVTKITISLSIHYFLNSVDSKWKQRLEIKLYFLIQYCSLGQTKQATCCTLSPSWPSLRSCPWSSHSHPYTWGSTTFPWAYGEAQHRRNETTQ